MRIEANLLPPDILLVYGGNGKDTHPPREFASQHGQCRINCYGNDHLYSGFELATET